MEYNTKKKEIDLKEKIINDLDKFALDFLNIVEKYTEYIVISGYVSILLGRSRSTEDIDMFIKKISKEQFSELYKELQEKGFWCINAEDEEEIFEYLTDKLAVRFSREKIPVPNFEVKFPKDYLDEQSFKDSINVILSPGKIRISSPERHIAFKELYLGTDKDFEDSKHVEEVFKGKIDYNKVNKIKELIKIRKENAKN